MRALVYLALCNERNASPASVLMKSLTRLGISPHLLARETTRVPIKGNVVLSRNDVHLDGLKREIGTANVSCLHSHQTTKPLRFESILEAADIELVDRWVKNYAPDFVIIVGDNAIENDPISVFLTSHTTKASLFKLQKDAKTSNWLLSANTKETLKLDISKPKQIDSCVSKLILTKVDAKKSKTSLDLLYQSAKNLPSKDLQAKPAPTKKPALLSPSMERELPTGEVESFRSGDVVLEPELWVKGWINCSAVKVKYLSVRINDTTHKLPLGGIRGDIAESVKSPDIFGFDHSFDITSEGTQLHVAVSIIDADNVSTDWKQLTLWSNAGVPNKYQTPVISGDAQLVEKEGASVVTGLVSAENHTLNSIEAFQDGTKLGIWEPTLDASKSLAPFEIHLSDEANTDLPMFLWITVNNAKSLFWLKLGSVSTIPSSIAADTRVLTQVDFKSPQLQTLNNGINHYVNGRAITDEFGSENGQYRLGNFLTISNQDSEKPCEENFWLPNPHPLSRQQQKIISVPAQNVLRQSPIHKTGSINRVLLIRREAAPTDELYILSPLRQLEREGRIQIEIYDLNHTKFDRRKVEQLLAPGTTVIVSRYITDEWISTLTESIHKLGKIFYLMDDDVPAAEDTPWLPANYRERMAKTAHGEFQTMVSLCDHFIVTSHFLKKRYDSPKTDLLEPAYLNPERDTSHFSGADKQFKIAYHGTLAHRDDVAMIAPALQYVHDRYPHTQIQIVMGNQVPGFLKQQPRVEIVKAMPWQEYKTYAEKCRAHVAIAPVLKTPYNLGKSVIKIHDIASLGAAGIYTNGAPYAGVIENGHNGLLLENDPLIWQKALSWLIENPSAANELAQNGQCLAKELGAPEKLMDYWIKSLDLASPIANSKQKPTSPAKPEAAHA